MIICRKLLSRIKTARTLSGDDHGKSRQAGGDKDNAQGGGDRLVPTLARIAQRFLPNNI
jgi:hypothetical protein